MKEVFLTLFQNDVIISALATGIATLIAVGLQWLIERIQSQLYRNALRKVVPIANEIFWIVEKEITNKKLKDKHLQKAKLFEKKFNEQFKKLWGRTPNTNEISIAKDVVGTLVSESKKK